MRVHVSGCRWIAGIVLACVFFGRPAAAAQTEILVGVHHTMHATLVTPDGPGPYPGVLVLHTSGGLREADIIYAQQLAAQGYVALVPAFMAAYGITSETRVTTFSSHADAIFADLVDALGVLAHQPLVNGAKLGAVGFSNGGYFAVWLALTGHVQAAVSYYGAYTGAGSDIAETRFRKAANANAAPILIVHGLNDDTVPVAAARRLAGILDGVHAPYEIQLYPAAGHAFDRGGLPVPPVRGNGRIIRSDPSGDTGDGAADADAWARTLAFFEKYLR